MARKIRRLNRHHINPSSRGCGDEDNIMLLDEDWHNAWHYCFENMLIDEVILMIRIMFTTKPHCNWSHRDIRMLRHAIRENDDVAIWEILTNLEEYDG